MGRNSSFHMGNEFNGNGENVYLHGTKYRMHAPLPAREIRLTPDFSQCVPRALGAVPAALSPVGQSQCGPEKAVEALAMAVHILVRKDQAAEAWLTDFHVGRNTLTDGSHLYRKQLGSTKSTDR